MRRVLGPRQARCRDSGVQRLGRRLLRPLAGLACGLPLAAQAHTPAPGLDLFYAGALHLFVVAPAAMALATAGALVGQRGLDTGAALLAVLLGGSLVGLIVGSGLGDTDTGQILLVLTLLGAGLAAWARPLPKRALGALLLAIGLAAGLGAQPEGLTGRDRLVFLAGCGVGQTFFALLVAEVVEVARAPWQRLLVRVACAWLAAASLLVAALALRPVPPLSTARHAAPASAPTAASGTHTPAPVH